MINIRTVKLFIIASTLISLLAACGSTPSNSVKSNLSTQCTPEYSVLARDKDPRLAYLHFETRYHLGLDAAQIFVNDELLVNALWVGWVTLPVVPGTYDLSYRFLHESESEDKPKESLGERTVTAGDEIAFMRKKGSFFDLTREYEEVDASFFEAVSITDNTTCYHPHFEWIRYAPPRLQRQVESCLNDDLNEACAEVSQSIPLGLLSEPLARKLTKADTKSHSMQSSKARQLPREILVDKITLALSQSLAQKAFPLAVSLFEQLEAMDALNDPNQYYFYAEALIETGNGAKALSYLSDYINTQGASALHYKDALILLNRAQETF